jgi:hypothetical protein
MSQSDYLSGIAARRPDSDEPGDRYRNYEIAGAAHATPDELMYCARPQDIQKSGRDVPPMDCNEGPRSRFPNSIAFNAIFQNLVVWVRDGTAPPHIENIAVEHEAPVLDPFGNVTGGVRSPFVDVPVSTWYGNSTGPSFCRIAGHEIRFNQARLRELYPTKDAYVRAVEANVKLLVSQRMITLEDGVDLIDEARKTDLY